MAAPENPFVTGGPVASEQFVGRKQEIERLFGQLNDRVRGSAAIFGERRIGKTSLMHYVKTPEVFTHWHLDEKKAIFIYLDCGSISPFSMGNFWRVILKNLSRTLKRKKTTPNLLEAVAALLGETQIAVDDIEFLLDDLHAAGIQLILMLDEFEHCIRSDVENEAATRAFLASLRSLINRVPRSLSMIVATRQSLDELCKDLRFMGSPFYNNFIFIRLQPFTKDESKRLLIHMLSGRTVTFNKAEENLIFDLSGTHPLLLQNAAALIFRLKVGGARTTQARAAIQAQFQEEVKHHFEEFWNSSSLDMRQILTYLASGKDIEANNLLETWSKEWETLMQRGLIVKKGKKYQLFSPIFQQWLSNNFYQLDVKQWLGKTNTSTPKKTRSKKSDLPTVFISYSHKDEEEKDALLDHLRVLEHAAGLIDLWNDDRIGGGQEWEKEISIAMDKAKVAILLISAHFLGSEFILGNEVPKLLQRHGSDDLVVIPVIAKACAWKQIEWLAKMNVKPKNGTPVWRKRGIHADEELAKIAEEVSDIMKRN